MAVRPDSKAVYVLNEQTSDVTIIDSATGDTLEKVGVDGFAVRFMPKAGIVLVVDSDAVHAIDYETHKKRDDLYNAEVAVFNSVEVSPDGRFAAAWGGTTLLCVDGTLPGAKVASQRFKRIADVVFAW
jgi:DNA-binding beta-propeller fold protein YncE